MRPGRALSRVALLLAMAALLAVAWRSVAGRQLVRVCTCELERQRSGWCEACQLGYVAGVTIRSKVLYDALDAHGHDVDVAGLGCASCRAAASSDGFCAEHSRGFVGGRLYVSRLAYHTARGEPQAVPRELELLASAVETSARCETCAAAIVLDGTCRKCRLSYSDGKPSPMR